MVARFFKEVRMVSRFWRGLARFWRDKRGQGLVEYALLLFLVAMIVIGSLRLVGKKTNNVATCVGDNLKTHSGSNCQSGDNDHKD
jgi:Flp pilus assembly pilin Flp